MIASAGVAPMLKGHFLERLSGWFWLALVSAMAAAGSAMAADLAGKCCADLEERVAELEDTVARRSARLGKSELKITGAVSKALLYWDDGGCSDVFSASTIRNPEPPWTSSMISSSVAAGRLDSNSASTSCGPPPMLSTSPIPVATASSTRETRSLERRPAERLLHRRLLLVHRERENVWLVSAWLYRHRQRQDR